MSNEYNRREAKEAKKDNFKVVKNSGRGHMKGDAKSENYLVDYKFNKSSFTLSLANWIKLTKDAWKEGQRLPIICVVFEGDRKVGIVPWEILQEKGILNGDS